MTALTQTLQAPAAPTSLPARPPIDTRAHEAVLDVVVPVYNEETASDGHPVVVDDLARCAAQLVDQLGEVAVEPVLHALERVELAGQVQRDPPRPSSAPRKACLTSTIRAQHEPTASTCASSRPR